MKALQKCLSPLLAAALLGGCSKSPSATPLAQVRKSLSRQIRKHRDFHFRYETNIPVPKGTQELHVWVPLPMVDPGVQRVANLKIEAPEGYRVTQEPTYGNRMLHLHQRNPASPLHLAWQARITRFEDDGQGQGPDLPVYRKPNRLVPIGGDAARLAARLGSDQKRLPIQERAHRIYEDVLNSMEYNKQVPGYGRGDFERAITVCKGNCTDFHARFIGVGRASGIPVRFTMGIPLKPVPSGQDNSYHCWAHFRSGEHWYPVDISEADKVADRDPARAAWYFEHLDANRIAMSFGRDIRLSPPQSGDLLNYFVFPYAEADGHPLLLTKDNWNFTYSNVKRPN